jgi:hypothetical protein
MRDAVLASGQESRADLSSLFGVDLASRQQDIAQALQMGQEQRTTDETLFGLDQAARQQAINESLLLRNQPFNEASSFLQGGAQLPMPQMQQYRGANIAPTDIIGPTYQSYGAQMDAYNAKLQSQAASTEGLFGILGTVAAGAMMASSRQYKTDDGPPESILDAVKRLPIRTWRYKWEQPNIRHIGPYAEDWAQLFGGDGLTISVIDALGVCLQAIKEMASDVHTLARSCVTPIPPSTI